MTPPQISRWEGATPSHWQHEWRLPLVEIYEVIASTNDRARALAAEGAPAGTLVMAEHQTAGRGRLGRTWHAPAGSSLLMSVLLRPAACAGGAPGTAPLRVGMAVADAIEAATAVRCTLKWPNDLLVPGLGKVAGVLCEAVSAGQDHLVVVGMGINVRQHPRDWPDDLRALATSLQHAAGRSIDRARVAGAIAAALKPLFSAPLLPLSDAELARFAARDALRDRGIVVDFAETATARGIERDGTLLVQRPDGTLERVTAATVRFAGSSAASTPSGATT